MPRNPATTAAVAVAMPVGGTSIADSETIAAAAAGREVLSLSHEWENERSALQVISSHVLRFHGDALKLPVATLQPGSSRPAVLDGLEDKQDQFPELAGPVTVHEGTCGSVYEDANVNDVVQETGPVVPL